MLLCDAYRLEFLCFPIPSHLIFSDENKTKRPTPRFMHMLFQNFLHIPPRLTPISLSHHQIILLFPHPSHPSSHPRKCITAQQNPKKTTTPTPKTHLSCLALLSIILIVSPLTPNVPATLYNLFCVPFKISLCCPRSPRTAWPRARYSSSAECVLLKKDCSRRACDSRVGSWAPKVALEL